MTIDNVIERDNEVNATNRRGPINVAANEPMASENVAGALGINSEINVGSGAPNAGDAADAVIVGKNDGPFGLPKYIKMEDKDWPVGEWRLDNVGTRNKPEMVDVFVKPKTDICNVQAWLMKGHIVPWHNVFTGEICYSLGTKGTKMSMVSGVSEYLHTLYHKSGAHPANPNLQVFREWFTSMAREHPFHPIKERLAATKWDGTPRIDRMLTIYFGAEDDALTRAISRKALIASVSRIYDPGAKVDTVPTLLGPQNAGKSTGIGALYYSQYVRLPANIDTKRLMEKTGACWVAEFADIEMKPSRIEDFKALLTDPSDKDRMAYAELADERPRQWTSWATTNHQRYLVDTTGNRRFGTIVVGKVDTGAGANAYGGFHVNVDALRRDRDQLWAEALTAYRAGEQWHLTNGEDAALEERNRAHTLTEPWEERLAIELAGKEGVLPNGQVLSLTGAIGKGARFNKWQAREIEAAMLRMGWKRRVPDNAISTPRGRDRVWVKGEVKCADGRPNWTDTSVWADLNG